jgi:hypothetical protein
LGLGGSGGKSGATIVHSPSLINGILMPPIYHTARVVLGALSHRPVMPAVLLPTPSWTFPDKSATLIRQVQAWAAQPRWRHAHHST